MDISRKEPGSLASWMESSQLSGVLLHIWKSSGKNVSKQETSRFMDISRREPGSRSDSAI